MWSLDKGLRFHDLGISIISCITEAERRTQDVVETLNVMDARVSIRIRGMTDVSDEIVQHDGKSEHR